MPTTNTDDGIPPRMVLDISWAAIIKVASFLLFVLLIVHVWNFILLLILAVFIAVTLEPVEKWLLSRGLSRRGALSVICIGTVLVSVGLSVFLIPPLVTEMGNVSNSLPSLRQEIISNTPAVFGFKRTIAQLFSDRADTAKIIESLLSLGQYAVAATLEVLLLLIFSLYFLIDGHRAYRWLLPYFSNRNQHRIGVTVDELLAVVSAYISGQLLTSVMATIFSLSVLSALGVPAAFFLSVLAGIFDILPVVGFFLFVIPACLLAMTISSKTAFLVFTIYTAYHMVETYVIIPKVYGARLQLSGLVILIGIVIASSVAGVLGAIAILPILASYPIIERVWLARQVGAAAVEEHKGVPAETTS